jgi:hypothetical protein
MLSLILIASVVDPHLTASQIIAIMAACAGLAAVTGAVLLTRGRLVRGRLSSDRRPGQPAAALAAAGAGPVRLPAAASVPAMRTREHEAIAAQASKENWRMPRLAMLAPAPMSAGRRLAMLAMWVYLVIAMAAVVVKVVLIATGH